MKIYRIDTIGEYTSRENALEVIKTYPDAKIWPVGNVRMYKGVSIPCKPSAWLVTIRREFVREQEFTNKQVAKMLPAWAKPDFGPKNIGAKVTAFYAANNRVVTDASGLVIGSDEYYDWLETQPDCFRQTRNYLESRYGARA